MRWKTFLISTVACVAVLPLASCSDNQTANPSADPSAVDLMVEQALDSLAMIDSEEAAFTLILSYPKEVRDRVMDIVDCSCAKQEPPWDNPAARAVISRLAVSPEEVQAVEMMVLHPESELPDTVFVVITDDQWYYVRSGDPSPLEPGFAAAAMTSEIDVYGSGLVNIGSRFCPKSEWIVVFYLPVCFYELDPHRFDGILDAWAPNPPCDRYQGGFCAGLKCGPAWDGPGYLGWYNYHSCWQIDHRASTEVGKLVQKRWLYTWRNAGRSDAQIAHSVRARIRY
jgi:hypothetical protein